MRRLGLLLQSEGWRPGAVVSSPYARARDSAAILVTMFGGGLTLELLPELIPEAEPDVALVALRAVAPADAPLLVVSHLPLVGRLAHELIGDDPGFSPGTLVEIALEAGGTGHLLRRIGPRDIPEAFGK